MVSARTKTNLQDHWRSLKSEHEGIGGNTRFTFSQRKENALPIAYVLLTHGAKPKGGIAGHPAAKQQLENFHFLAKKAGKPDAFAWQYDHSRKFLRLNDLPKLKRSLEIAKELGVNVLIDDFRRLTANCQNGNSLNLFFELREYKGHFSDIRTGRDIGDFHETQIVILCSATSPIKYVYAPTPRKPRSERELRHQTFAASLASRKARAEAADAKAHELMNIRDQLQASNERVSYRDIAEAANARGLITTHGNPWSAQSVSRVLKRLAVA